MRTVEEISLSISGHSVYEEQKPTKNLNQKQENKALIEGMFLFRPSIRRDAACFSSDLTP